jgi:hypothetical protein
MTHFWVVRAGFDAFQPENLSTMGILAVKICAADGASHLRKSAVRIDFNDDCAL